MPQHGGKDCSSLGPSTETEECNTNGCPGRYFCPAELQEMNWEEMIPTRLGLYQDQNKKRTLQNNFKNFEKFGEFLTFS